MKRILLLLPLALLVLNSCVQTPDPQYPKRINYRFNVNHTGDTLAVNQDTIWVDQVKLLADKFNVEFSKEGVIQSRPDAMVMYFGTNNTKDELVLGANIGYKNINDFNGFKLFIAPPADSDNIQDEEFFGEQENYSFIMKGEYNGNDFTYKSGVSFSRSFSFSPVVLSDQKPTLVIRVLMDLKDFLIEPSGDKILDPENSDNYARIDSLMKNSIETEAFATEIAY